MAVPIHAQHKAREIAAQIEDCEARAVIAWDKHAPETEKAVASLDLCKMRIYLGDEVPAGAQNFLDLMQSGEPTPSDDQIDSEDVAAILYTSGVSGRPLGVELTHANFDHSVGELIRLLRLRETDKFLGLLPLSGISGLTLNLYLPLRLGAEVIIHSRFHPGDALDALTGAGVTIVAANPSMYRLMVGFPGADHMDLSKLRYPLNVDAKLSADLARDAEQRLRLKLFEGYGTTETCGIVALNLFPGLDGRESVGTPIGGMEIVILGDDNTALSNGKVGRVAVRGPSVMRGYRNRPERTRQMRRDGWHITGDVGKLDDESNLILTGHSQELIIKGGFPVHVREVEQVIEGLPHVQDVAVVGITDQVFGEEIKACVVLKDGASISPSEIVEYAKERLSVYKCPKIVKFYRELPRGAGGKIARQELREDR